MEDPNEILPPTDKFYNLSILPRDVKLLPLYKLDYDEIINICQTSKDLNKICNDERFWREYAFKNNIIKNKENTWKEVVKNNSIISEFSKIVNGKILSNIEWNLTVFPNKNNVAYSDIINGEKVLKRITEKQLNKIVFTNEEYIHIYHIKLWWPDGVGGYQLEVLQNYGKFRKFNKLSFVAPKFYIKRSAGINIGDSIKIVPDTKYGSTLKYVLESIYRAVWELPKNENGSINELISTPGGGDFNYYFNGLKIEDISYDYDEDNQPGDFEYIEYVMDTPKTRR